MKEYLIGSVIGAVIALIFCAAYFFLVFTPVNNESVCIGHSGQTREIKLHIGCPQ